MNKEHEELSIELPKRTKIRKPMRPETAIKRPKALFNSRTLDNQTQMYEIISPQYNSPLKESKNPQLVAIRNKTAKTKTRPSTNYHLTEKTFFNDQTETLPSLLTSRPLTAQKPKPKNSVEIVQHEVEMERQSLMFTEDPIAYFSKCKDGTG